MATQHINLYLDQFRPVKPKLSAIKSVVILGALVVTQLSIGFYVTAGNVRSALNKGDDPQPLMAQVEGFTLKMAEVNIEIDKLNRGMAELEHSLSRVNASLKNEALGQDGLRYTDYFKAFSNHANGEVWITSFKLAADANSIEVRGKMMSPASLPRYLNQINAEPLFKGRQFSQLEVSAPGAASASSNGQSASSGSQAYDFLLKSTKEGTRS